MMIWQSKKATASMLAAILSGIGVWKGYSLEEIALVVGPVVGYVLSQGLADVGKEAKKVSGP